MQLWNSYENKFTELEDKEKYELYVCGVTPYDTAHVGHGATFTYFDTLVYHLEHNHGKTVNYVQNITDIDDSIIARAKSTNEDIFDLARSQTAKLVTSMQRLGLRKPNKMPKVSEKINEIIKAAQELNNNGFLYKLNDDWYFDYSKTSNKIPDLHLSEKVLTEIFNNRGGNTKIEGKRNPFDFIVWQHSEVNEPEFNSELGPGRPGWHIECTAMLLDEFGGEIDIHGGGEELKFPHHTSEMSQNIGLGNNAVAKIWMHTGSVNFFGEKMSKSLGNLIYIDELIGKYPSAAIKIAILNSHYLNGFSWNEKLIEGSFAFYKRILEAVSIQENNGCAQINSAKDKIMSFLDFDLDTPAALREIADLVDQVLDQQDSNKIPSIKELCELLNLDIN